MQYHFLENKFILISFAVINRNLIGSYSFMQLEKENVIVNFPLKRFIFFAIMQEVSIISEMKRGSNLNVNKK